MEPLPDHAGAASSLLGCSQTLVAAASAALVAALFPLLCTLAVSTVMAGFALAALLAWMRVESRG